MFKFDRKNINNFSKITLKAKITLVLLWNALFFMEVASWLDWDLNNIEKLTTPDFRLESHGFILTALIGGFLLTRFVYVHKPFEKWLFVQDSNAEENKDMLNFLSLVLGLLAFGWLIFTMALKF